MWGNSPTSTIGPNRRPRDSVEILARSEPGVNVAAALHRSGAIPRYATIRPSVPREAR